MAGGGSDIVHGGTGDDTLFGEGGNDSLTGGGGEDSLVAGTGNDTVHAGNDNDTVFGNGGNDLITGGNGDDSIQGGLHNDTISGDGGSDTILGNDGNDVLFGGAGFEHISGNEGNDLVHGGNEADFVFGDDGSDAVTGGAGNDYIETNADFDRYASGGTGWDYIAFANLVEVSNSDLQDDYAIVDASNAAIATTADNAFGYSGAEGGVGNDILRGAGLVGFLDGGEGNDIIDATIAHSHSEYVAVDLPDRQAAIYLFGGSGHDIIFGGARNNTFFGEQSIDKSQFVTDWEGQWDHANGSKLLGNWGTTGSSSEVLATGYSGTSSNDQDIFVIGSNFTYGTLSSGQHYDVIHDFDVSKDSIDISYLVETASDISTSQQGSDVHFDVTDASGNTRTVVIVGGTKSVFDANMSSIFNTDDYTVTLTAMEDTHDLIAGLVLPVAGAGEGLTASTFYSQWSSATLQNADKNNFVHNNSESDELPRTLGFMHDIFVDDKVDSDTTDLVDDAKNNIAGNDGQDIIFMGDGNDTIHGDDQADLLIGGAGSDVIEGNRGNDLILGSDGGNPTVAGDGQDLLSGGWGDDLIDGGRGEDHIKGDFGNDLLYGNGGNDSIDGGLGNDIIYGDSYLKLDGGPIYSGVHAGIHGDVKEWFDNEFVAWSDGNALGSGSTVVSSNLTDTLNIDFSGTDAGGSTVTGNVSETLTAWGYGDDLLFGGFGDDQVFGGVGNDTVSGNSGDDSVKGEAGNDIVRGGSGNDTISGGTGNDTLHGEAGADTFEFGSANGNDTIGDFSNSEDAIKFYGISQSTVAVSQSGGDTIISYGSGISAGTIALEDVSLTLSDIMFQF